MQLLQQLRNFILFLILIVAVTGCGNFHEKFGRLNSGESKVGFSLSKANEDSSIFVSLQGRVLVYLVGVNGTNFVTNIELQNESDAQQLIVPNGQYKVFAVGWVGTNPVEGQGYCGFGDGGNVIDLRGGSVTIPLSMSTGNCNFTSSSIFADAGYTGSTDFSTVSVDFCNGITGSPTCTSNDSSFGGNYLKMNFDIYKLQNGVYQKLGNFEFGCGFINTNNAASSKKIPMGNSSGSFPKIFAVNFSVHSDSSCTSAPLISFSAREGIRNGATSGAVASAVGTSGATSTFFVDP